MDYRIIFPHLHLYLRHVPKSIHVFGFEIALYGIVIATGMVLATLLVMAVARRTGQTPDDYLNLAILGIIISVICARLYYVAFSWDLYKDHPLSILNIRQGGLAIYGGVIGAVFSAWLYARIKKLNMRLVFDTAVLGLVLGQIIGRWGNFFNREAFGGYTDGLLAMRLPVSAVRASDISSALAEHQMTIDGIQYIQVHPTFLYESLWNLALLILLLLWTRHKKFNGEVFCLYLVGYGIGRAWIEGLRTDQLLIPGTSLAVSQVLSVILAALGVLLLLIGRRVHRRQKTAGTQS
ncbi:prolipoprotein diacylglyceryltransferase [Clostridium sp. SY8519]|jgi:phosphatidylglycerol:prolipoprotein diacylglycerol transferase|uniref:prolipoprotein diacylglyceryl transferase n=1 Tax=Clostridium sp. (strain SY8519) TaxID=1042156 RepID=UPI000217209E|nr:prolipoprotein diacylglyceryl transferase [Clostridium sp. SY8519]BAK46229.1 prolipoprotein diacylglyceryltransferase [Clostridium sp. SY8519]